MESGSRVADEEFRKYDAFVVFEYEQEKLLERFQQKELEEQANLFTEKTMKFVTDLIASWRSRFPTNPRTEQFIALLKEDYIRELEFCRNSAKSPSYESPKTMEDLYREVSGDEHVPSLLDTFKRHKRIQFAYLMCAARNNTKILQDGIDMEYNTVGWSQSIPVRVISDRSK